MFAKQPDVFQQEIAEIGGVENLQPLLIGRIELAATAVAEHGGFARRHLRGRQAAILPAVDQSGEHPRRPALVVDIVGGQKLLQQPDLIVDIEHGEIGFQLHHLGVKAQDASADRMEGAEPRHALDGLAEHVAEAQFHFARRLVGEGDREDFVGPRPAHAEDVGDARGQHAGLAGAGARQHQDRSVQRFHRLTLLGIETCQILRRCGCARTRGNASGHRLMVGDGLMGQLVRLGHANRLVPTMAPRGREREPS